jgi:hypothetical protein
VAQVFPQQTMADFVHGNKTETVAKPSFAPRMNLSSENPWNRFELERQGE